MSQYQPPQHGRQQDPWDRQQPANVPANVPSHVQRQYQPQPQPPARHLAPAAGLTTAGQFWYVLQCIAMGAGYFAKIPAKKAMQDFGMTRMTSAEQFWYVLMCIAFGGGYFAKLPTAKALSELPQFR